MGTMSMVMIPFQGDVLEAVTDERGVWVGVRRVCDSLGVAVQRQLSKLRDKTWATVTMKVTVAEDGKAREVAMIHLDSLPMWLARIEPSRVRPGSAGQARRLSEGSREGSR